MKTLLLAGLAALALAPATAASARPMTATDLATMRRIAAPAVSPDGTWAVYQLRETDLAANRGRSRPVAARPATRRRRAGPDRLHPRA